MMKNKYLLRAFLIYGILFVVYNIIVFTLFGLSGHQSDFWISYLFSILAFAMVIVCFKVCFQRGTLEEGFYGYSIFYWNAAYLAIEVVITVIFMFIPYNMPKASIIIQMIPFAAFLILLLSSSVAKDTIEKQEQEEKQQVMRIRLIQADIESIADRTENVELKKRLKKIAETVRYSDPVSNTYTESYEISMEGIVEKLSQIVTIDFEGAFQLCNEFEIILKDRNRKSKYTKGVH